MKSRWKIHIRPAVFFEMTACARRHLHAIHISIVHHQEGIEITEPVVLMGYRQVREATRAAVYTTATE